jgi:hypothetical protein
VVVTLDDLVAGRYVAWADLDVANYVTNNYASPYCHLDSRRGSTRLPTVTTDDEPLTHLLRLSRRPPGASASDGCRPQPNGNVGEQSVATRSVTGIVRYRLVSVTGDAWAITAGRACVASACPRRGALATASRASIILSAQPLRRIRAPGSRWSATARRLAASRKSASRAHRTPRRRCRPLIVSCDRGAE